MRDPRRALRAILLLLFLSGTCGLAYQIVWVRMLVLVFGTSTFAVSTVLTAFMAGLALGSAAFGRLADRRINGLRLYAVLELGIGVFALAFPALLAGLDELYTALYRALGDQPYAFALSRFALAFLVLLVPTTLMGGTLPVLVRHVAGATRDVGWSSGILYAVNTCGAAAGCVAAAFVLLETAGVRGTIVVAAAGNLFVFVVAWWLGGRPSAGRETAGSDADGPDAVPQARATSPVLAHLVFWGYGLSGLAALGYEVVWTRLLSVILRITTTQSLSTILIVFLFGLAVGGAAGARWADRAVNPGFAFGLLQILLGLSGLGSIVALGAAPSIAAALDGLPDWGGHLLRLLAAAGAVMLVPTFLMGLLFPLAVRLHAPGRRGVGRRVGSIYAVNTAGAIAGAFASGFALIPWLGAERSLQVLAALNLAVGVAVLLASRGASRVAGPGLAAASALGAAVLVFLLPPGFLVERFRVQPGSKVIYHDEAAAGTVTVHEYPDGQRVLRVNGAGEVPTDPASLRVFRLLGHLPMLLHPDPQDVLVVAFGAGITLAAVELHGPRRLDCVEVVPEVLGAAPWFERWNRSIHRRVGQGGLRVILDDGRNHVLRTEQHYDVIISDATHPATADSWVLYTEGFYRLCRERLASGGFVAQWLPLHGLTEEDYRMILRTFGRIFPHASLWLTPGYSVLLGTPEPLEVDFERLTSRLAPEEVQASLEEVGLGQAVSIVATLALDEHAFAAYAGEGAINSDDRPAISFGDRRRAGTNSGLPVALSLIPHLGTSPQTYVAAADPEDRARLSRRSASRRHGFRADVALRLGQRERALDELRRAIELDPTDAEPRRRLVQLERAR